MNQQSRALANQVRATIEQTTPDGECVARAEVIDLAAYRVLTSRADELRKVHRGCFTFGELEQRAAEFERAAADMLTEHWPTEDHTSRTTGELGELTTGAVHRADAAG